MENPTITSAEQEKESILTRKKIEAPPNFVSVFHETTSEFIPNIDKHGLKLDAEVQNMGSNEGTKKRNQFIDQFRPENLKKAGVSRKNNIYAYPFLEHGHGLSGAARRFIKEDDQALERDFSMFSRGAPHILEEMGVKTPAEYIAKMNDPEYRKNEFPGEVIELKIDPENSYVGDLQLISDLFEDIINGRATQESAEYDANFYWQNLITLKNFLKWYRHPEWDKNGDDIKNAHLYKKKPSRAVDFHLLKDAPDNLPDSIDIPEILIPEDVPQEHIKIVK